MTIEERLDYLEKRQKLVEEDLAYCHRDLINLINIIENCEPEVHYHFYQDFRTCKDDLNNSNDLNDFI